METILTDITGTIGQWLDEGFDSEVPVRVVKLLQEAYNVSANELENPLHVYNNMLKERFGQHITVSIKEYVEDDGSKRFYITSAKHGDSISYETVEEAYNRADLYLRLVE